jgi:hypothetical protein
LIKRQIHGARNRFIKMSNSRRKESLFPLYRNYAATLVRVAAVVFLLLIQTAVGRAATGNPIVAENQNSGSSNWTLSKPANDSSKQIKGYASALSVNHGQSIDFHISVSPAQNYSIEIFRLGYYAGTGGRLMTTIGPLSGTTQATCPVDSVTGLIACTWPVSYTLAVPASWVTGVYVAKLTNAAGYQNYIIFTVRDDDRNPDLIFQSSVTTYNAYNNYPNDGSTGKSAYDSNSYGANTISGGPAAVKVSFDRPYADSGAGDVFNWEHYLIRFIEQMGYDVSYTTDMDTHVHPERLLDAKGFLSTGHDEYWSGAMFDGVEAARDAGVNLAFFGANTAYWQMRMEPSAGGVANRVMVIYRYANLDPEPDPAKKTIRFRETGRPEQRLIGVQYVDWNQWNQSTGFVAQDTSHWIFNGTGFTTGDVVAGIMGYEVDTQFSGYPLPDSVSYTLLGHSPFTGLIYGSVMADTSIYETSLGNQVFASGSIFWSWGLNRSGYENAGVRTMTKNLLDRFVGPAPPRTAPVVTNPGQQDSVAGSTVSLHIAASDPQGDPLVFTAESLPAGLTMSASTGVISGIVDNSAIGTHIASVHVSDGTKTSTVNFYWVVTAFPELADCGAPGYNSATDAYLYLWKDCGSDNWHLVLSGGGSDYDKYSGTIESSTGFISVTAVNYEPPGDSIDNTSDPDKIVFGFTSGGSSIDELDFIPQAGAQMCFKKTASVTNTPVRVGHSATITVPPFDPTTRQACYQVNTAPVVTNPGPQSSVLGGAVSLQIVASDAENNPLTYTADALPAGLSIGAATGLISGTVSGNAGIYNVDVHVSDGLLTTTVNFDWAVSSSNTAPQVTNPGPQTSTEGDTVSLQVTSSDAENNALTYTAEGLPAGLTIGSTTGLIAGTVAAGSAGVHSVSVHVSDGLLTTTVNFTWTVNGPTNTAPQVTNPGPQTSTEGDAVSLQVTSSDAENNALTYTADGLPAGLTIGSTTGLITGTVAAGSAGVHDVSVHVSDGLLTTTVNFTWTVAADAAPQVTNPGGQHSVKNDVVSLSILAFDADGDTLSYSAAGLPSGLGIKSGTGVISGKVRSGTAQTSIVSVHVTDGLLTTTVTFTWALNLANTAPQVNNPGSQTSTEGNAVSLQVTASDAQGDTLTYTADGLPAGLTIGSTTGLISGTVAAGSAGVHSASVHVSDGALSSTVNFSWTVNSAIQPDGDVNEDGVVDAADLLLAQRALLGEITLTSDQQLHADMAPLQNGIPVPDGVFNLGDVLVIARKVLGLIN